MAELEFVSVASTSDASELKPSIGTSVDPAFATELVHQHEQAGFAAVLANDSSSSADAAALAGQLLTASSTIRVLVTERPGVSAPTAVARQLATLAAFHPGRVGVHIPAVDSDREAARDGDWLDRASRQRRRVEYADILHRCWTSDRPFDVDGEFYRLANTWTPLRPKHPIPFYASGMSVQADEFGARYADVYCLPAMPAALVGARIAAVRAMAADRGRALRVALRLRPVLAPTRAAAVRLADRIARIQSTASLDEATGAVAGLGSLVGTTAEVAATIETYLALGVDSLRLVAWQPHEDVALHAELIARLREATARRRAG